MEKFLAPYILEGEVRMDDQEMPNGLKSGAD
jgi:hypothetical protein